MGKAIVTYKIMPVNPEVDMDALQGEVLTQIKTQSTGDTREELEPLAFGLKALKVTFVVDEDEGDLDALEDQIKGLENVGSLEVVDMRRALG